MSETQSFPRKTLPSGAIDIDSLQRHINDSDPHPGVYIQRLDNELNLDHPTLYNLVTDFRKKPTETTEGYTPRLVFYTGETKKDEVTGLTYTSMHPYIYSGATKTVDGEPYPVWVDKIEQLGGISKAQLDSAIYNHATDSDTTVTDVHPTLAKKTHYHRCVDDTGQLTDTIPDLTEGVFIASKGIYAYIAKTQDDVTSLQARNIDKAVMIYAGVSLTTSTFKQGRLYQWDAANKLWTDISAPVDAYTKTQIDNMIIDHNTESSSLWSHNAFSRTGHKHYSSDIDNFKSEVINAVGDSVDAKITVHDDSATSHQVLFNNKEDAGVAASKISDHDALTSAHGAAFQAYTNENFVYGTPDTTTIPYSGYQILPTGLIIEYGCAKKPINETTVNVTLPKKLATAFSITANVCAATTGGTAANTAVINPSNIINENNTQYFTAYTTDSANEINFFWMCIGIPAQS